MVAYTSKGIEPCISIDNHSLQCLDYSPTKHLAAQSEAWHAMWHPANSPELADVVNELLKNQVSTFQPRLL